jgi:hypothetical protein
MRRSTGVVHFGDQRHKNVIAGINPVFHGKIGENLRCNAKFLTALMIGPAVVFTASLPSHVPTHARNWRSRHPSVQTLSA